MTPAEQREAFRRSLRRQLARRRSSIDAGVLDLVKLLEELHGGIRKTLEAQPSTFAAHQLPRLLEEVNRQIEQTMATAVGRMGELAQAAWRLGPELVDGPLGAAGIRVGGPLISDSLVGQLKTYAADKVQGLDDVARARVGKHIRLAVLGGQTPHQAMVGIGETVDAGPMKYVSFRAETIVRTEVGKIHSAAADARLVQAAEQLPGLGKEWLWSGKARAIHAAANGQRRPAGEPYELSDGTKMMYPREAGAPVGHVANCGCESIPWMASWGT